MFEANKRLYYFTGPNFAVDILARRHLKVSFPDEVNDIFEMTPFDFGEGDSAKEMRRDWKKAIRTHAEQFGFVSFSENWDVPSMWGHYAQSHSGVCIGFDVSGRLERIDYKDEFLKFPYSDLETPQGRKKIFDYAIQTKSKHWEFESEWRLFVQCQGVETAEKRRGAKVFFVPFAESIVPREIIIGARSDLKTADFEAAIANDEDVTVRTARASFRGYKMVEQINTSLKK